MDLIKKANVELFARMCELITESRADHFKIIGYKSVKQRLVLYFRDCAQVYEFSLYFDWDEKTYEVEKTDAFYTNDYDFIDHVRQFEIDMNLEQPE